MGIFSRRQHQDTVEQADGSPRTLLDETNPYGSRRVLVATNGTETWAQLFDGSGSQVTALWLAAHHGPSPDIQLSVPPEATRNPQGHRPFNRLEAVWFEEGDGIALYDEEGMLAVLPGWAGPDSLPGYAREATSPTPSAAPLSGALEQFTPRADRARGYWTWRNAPGNWEGYQQELAAHVMSRLGPATGYWPLGDTPPQVVAERHGTGTEHVAVTVGMSGQRMPTVEQYVDDPGPHSRVELAVAGLGAGDTDILLLRWLAMHPWRAATWLGARHTVKWPGPGFPLPEPFTGVLLVDEPSLLAGPSAPDLSGFSVHGDRVRFLWLVPVSDEEIGVARTDGVDALLARLRAAGRSWVAGDAGAPQPSEPAAEASADETDDEPTADETDDETQYEPESSDHETSGSL